MDITQALSIYGAILGTIACIWQLTDRGELLIDISNIGLFSEKEKTVTPRICIHIVNSGKRPIQVNQLEILKNLGLKGAARLSTEETRASLPLHLDQSKDFSVYIDPKIFDQYVIDVQATDSTGKIWKLNKKQKINLKKIIS